MKAASKMPLVKEALKRSNTTCSMIENCGMPDEHIYHCIDEIPDQASYYSIIVVKRNRMIKLQDLTKQYDKFLAVDHLNLTIETGEFLDFWAKWCRKTTTISMLSTLLLPTKGSIQIDGEPLTKKMTG